MITLEANLPFVDAPEWAVLQRGLIDLLNGSVDPVMERYIGKDDSVLWPTTETFTGIDGLDDAYESFHNWPVLYLLGGDENILDLSHRMYDGITRQFSKYNSGHGHPMVVKEYEQGYDWMHQGEGYVFFYNLCLADPANRKNIERAQRYAGFYLNEDPEAPNYDPVNKLIRCAHNGSMGPAHRNFEKLFQKVCDRTSSYGYEFWHKYPLPFLDIPGIESAEDLLKPGMGEAMAKVMGDRMSRGDVACNLAATTMVTNAYLCTGDENYRSWVKEYVDAWIERTQKNNGILPDNIGLSGEIGEYIDGKWYGGYYGWTWPHGWETLGDACISAAENAALLHSDPSYINFPRSQVDVMMEHGHLRDKTLHVPQCHNDKGWTSHLPMRGDTMAHIWGMSMAEEYMERIKKLRNYDERDFTRVKSHGSKHGGGHEAAWIAYLQGEYPNYPSDILRHNYSQVYQRLDFMRCDQQDPSTYGDWYLQRRNPITVEGLIQLTMGGPLFMYNGGLLMVRLRYFDVERRRPGLPRDVAALIEKLEDSSAILYLVNLNPTKGRELIVQGGAFAEHRFTHVSFQRRQNLTAEQAEAISTHPEAYKKIIDGQKESASEEVKAARFKIRMLPGSMVRLELGMERYVENPSYSEPWS